MTRRPKGRARAFAAGAAAALAGLALAAGAGAALFVWSGLYDIGSTRQHFQWVYTLLEVVGEQSIRHHARRVAEPPLDDDALVARGALCYRDKCLACHGGPGVAQSEIGRSMQPLPGPLVDAAAHFRARELYWVTKKGIKMSGMPAWEHHLSEADLWATVALLRRLPRLAPDAFAALTLERTGEACASAPAFAEPAPGDALPPPDAARGRVALTQFACNACHRVPGVTGSEVHVGPPLAGIAGRALIAGQLANTPESMVRWIRDPRGVDPKTAMPDMGVGERDARDIAAYLATLH